MSNLPVTGFYLDSIVERQIEIIARDIDDGVFSAIISDQDSGFNVLEYFRIGHDGFLVVALVLRVQSIIQPHGQTETSVGGEGGSGDVGDAAWNKE